MAQASYQVEISFSHQGTHEWWEGHCLEKEGNQYCLKALP